MTQLFTALITPFTNENNIDFEALGRLVNLQIEGQAHGIVILGTTAEAELLSFEEQTQIIKFVTSFAKDKLKIIVGCGKSSTKETLELARHAFNYQVDAVMVVMPPYVKPDAKGLILHFKTISDAGIPFIAYHHPFRTGCQPSIKTLEALLELPMCRGLKDASGGCDVMRSLAHKYTLFSGDDNLLLPHLSLGASGIISVCSNLIPEIFVDVLNNFESNPLQTLHQFRQYSSFIDAIFKIPNPIGIKNALFHAKFINDNLRLPYTSADQESSLLILQKFQELPKITGVNPKETSFSLI